MMERERHPIILMGETPLRYGIDIHSYCSTVAVRYAQRLGNQHGGCVCIEWPHSLVKPEGIVHTGFEIDETRDKEGRRRERDKALQVPFFLWAIMAVRKREHMFISGVFSGTEMNVYVL